jgi:hypothetical protein
MVVLGKISRVTTERRKKGRCKNNALHIYFCFS